MSLWVPLYANVYLSLELKTVFPLNSSQFILQISNFRDLKHVIDRSFKKSRLSV